MTSLRRALLAALLAAVVVVTVGGGVATYRIVRREVSDALDYQLRLIGLSLRDRALGLPRPSGPVEGELELVIQVWDLSGERLYASAPAEGLPGPPREAGLGSVSTRTGDWRVFSVPLGGQVLQVAQPEAVRSRIAFAAAARTLAPLLVLLPVLALLVWWIVGRGLRPLGRLARQAARRSAASLEPFPEEGAPGEVLPLVRSLNGLMARLSSALESQRAFVADAAHELRTPLAVLKLQAQLAARARDDGERSGALRDLEAGLDRASRVVHQLLTLARQEPGGERARAEVGATVALDELLAQAVADHAPLAESKGTDLGVAGGDPRACGARRPRGPADAGREPGGQRLALHASRGAGGRAGRAGGAIAGRRGEGAGGLPGGPRHRPGHPRPGARAGLRSLLPAPRQRRDGQRPGPGGCQGDRRAPRRPRHPG